MSAGPSFAAGEESLRSILAVWRMEAECPPMTRPTLAELGPFEDDRAQREAQDYIDEWDDEWHADRHRRIAARVAFTDALLALWDAIAETPRGEQR